MLTTLRRIIQAVNATRNLGQVLHIIVTRVKQDIGVDVCSVYLMDHNQKQAVLAATDGLNPDSVGRVRMSLQEGLVGWVSRREEPVNLDDAQANPQYRYFPETGEEQFHSFLGVPIVHHRKVLGVLVVQRHEAQRFAEDEEAFLVTIAAQLAGAIAHAEASGGVTGPAGELIHHSGPIEGLVGAPGVAIGTVVVVYPGADLNAIPERHVEDGKVEKTVFLRAVEQVRMDIKAMIERLADTVSVGDRALFEAYLMMLDSDVMVENTLNRIRAGDSASWALRTTINEHARVFEGMDDTYLRERSEDVRDLGRRILIHIQHGPRTVFKYPANTVLVGEAITASMLAEVPKGHLVGVVCASGSTTSHVAILARALNVPAVMGAEDVPVDEIDGKEIVVDGYQGLIYIAPAVTVRDEYQRLAQQEVELSDQLQGLHDQPAVTTDGVEIPLLANAGLVAELVPLQSSGAYGIGLYRTEFPFMIRERFPSEEEQRRIYRETLQSFAPLPVTIRTLDVGGDKVLPYFPIVEDNPFLGWRGIRVTLDHPEIFLVQLRAMLRANAGLHNMKILFPMISTTMELEEALRLLRRAHHELIDTDSNVSMPEVGVMIEVPSAVYQASNLARRVDFLSIGSNDLTQYLLAVDRNNARVGNLYDALHPAVLMAMVQVVEGAREHHKPVAVCGEMACDPAAVILLLGMGIDSLSMSVASIPRIKWVVRSFSRAFARELLQLALEFENPYHIRRMLNAALEEAGLGGLVRAGR